MKNTENKRTQAVSTISTSKKISMIAGSTVVLYALPGISYALPVSVNGTVSLDTSSIGNSATWDIDGNLTDDFLFAVDGTNFTSGSGTSFFGTFSRSIYDDVQNPANRLRNVDSPSSNTIDSGMTGFVNGFNFLSFLSTFSSTTTNKSTSQSIFWNNSGDSSPVSGILAFEFSGIGGLHYGWANITLVLDGLNNSSLAINDWCYEDEANTAIHSGSCSSSVPEPGVPSLLLIGLGAAGIRRWREQKNSK